MGLFDIFRKKPTHSEKVSLAYQAFRSDIVESIFPGKIQQAEKIIISLGKIFDVNMDTLDANDYLELLKIYMDVLIRKVSIPMSDDGIINSLQMRHNGFVKSDGIAKRVLVYTQFNMLNHDFVLESQADLDLLPDDIVSSAKEGTGSEEKQEECVEFGYYFENGLELAIYGKLFGGDNVVNWLKGDAYLSQYKRGYQLVEEGKYLEAIAILNTSLKVNPIGISSRFEMCECYIRLNDLDKTRKILMDMSAYLLDAKHIAKFYRRMGYIEIENGNNLAALACYLYSKNFESHPSVEQELQYISEKTGISVNDNVDAPAILKKYDIPILVERKLDEIEVPRQTEN